MEYAYELEPDAEIRDARPAPSVFTSVLVQALATGETDRGGGGLVSVDELYDYIYDEVRAHTTLQTPNRLIEVEGEMVVAGGAVAPAAFLVFLLSAVVTSIAGGSPSETETSANGNDPGLLAPIFLSVCLGGRLLLVVPAWLGRHVRLPLLGRFAETLAMRRY
jgi:hypothetical protein